jgi:hypothetical protein
MVHEGPITKRNYNIAINFCKKRTLKEVGKSHQSFSTKVGEELDAVASHTVPEDNTTWEFHAHHRDGQQKEKTFFL